LAASQNDRLSNQKHLLTIAALCHAVSPKQEKEKYLISHSQSFHYYADCPSWCSLLAAVAAAHRVASTKRVFSFYLFQNMIVLLIFYCSPQVSGVSQCGHIKSIITILINFFAFILVIILQQ
jgi:hypothetical protein